MNVPVFLVCGGVKAGICVALRNRIGQNAGGKEEAMNILHVRGVPDELYTRLKKLAQSQNRSLSAQVIVLLTQAIEDEERRKKQAKALNSIRRRRFTPPKNAPTSLELLKEDRSR